MFELKIIRSDDSIYWVEYFNSMDELNRWLTTERARSYWDGSWTTEAIDHTPVTTTEDLTIKIRAKRDGLLLESDWTQLSDSPLSSGKKTEWATYRQALRDLPDQQGFDPQNVTWPDKPA